MFQLQVFQSSIKHLNQYLSNCRRQYFQCIDQIKQGKSQSIHFVTGNEAADADSILSSIVYAQSANIVPVLPIPKVDLALRSELTALFNYTGLEMETLLDANEVDFQFLHDHDALQLTLTDHNQLSHSMQHLGNHVVKIIDHHQDVGDYASVNGKDRIIAFDSAKGDALAGSCCTLIAEQFQKENYGISPIEALYLLSAITLDTVNYDLKAGKVTQRDVDMKLWLNSKIQSKVSVDQLFHWLQQEKFNLEHWKTFSFLQCLRYDYKQFQNNGLHYGISSVLVTIPEILAKQQDEEEWQSFCSSRGIACLLIMSNQNCEVLTKKRQVLVYSSDSTTLQKVTAVIENLSILQLESLQTGTNWNLYKQTNHLISRKRLVPLIQQVNL